MRRTGFYAALIMGIVVPTAVAVAASRPAVRAFASAFFAPPPAPPSLSRDAGIVSLPVESFAFGVESPELQSLADPDAGSPPARAARHAVFVTEVRAAPGYQRPPEVPRTALLARGDGRLDPQLAYLAREQDGHGALIAALKRSRVYRPEVERILRAWKIPEALTAVAFVESAFSATASAPDGGAGLWSLSPEVARAYGLVMLPSYDERRSVAISTEAAAHHLSDLRERFGSWELALYAFGGGYVRAVSALGNRPRADFESVASELPEDAVSYVREVLAVATVLGSPDAFGFDETRGDEPLSTSDLEIPAGTPFGTVARASGTTVARLRELNPEYLADYVPSTGFAMIMHVPSAGLARAKELLMPLLYAEPGSGLARAVAPSRAADAGVGGG